MAEARYDAAADFYAAAFDDIDDPATAVLLDDLAGTLTGVGPQWTEKRPGASRVPVYLAGRCVKVAR
jgi:hypothetical protein